MENRTYYYNVNGNIVKDGTENARNKFIAYREAQERADRTAARNKREYIRKLTEQKKLGCAMIITGLISLALSAIVVECITVSIPMLLFGTYAATTTKILL